MLRIYAISLAVVPAGLACAAPLAAASQGPTAEPRPFTPGGVGSGAWLEATPNPYGTVRIESNEQDAVFYGVASVTADATVPASPAAPLAGLGLAGLIANRRRR